MTDPRHDEHYMPEIKELAQSGGWMLGAETSNGVLVSRHLFLVSDEVLENSDEAVRSIEKINRLKTLGRGYHFTLFLDPCLGCEISLEPGWELPSEVMQREFLNRFLKVFELGTK